MIALLRGVLADKGIDHVLVDVNGVGYRVAVSLNTLAALPPVGATATVHTELIVREDSLSLVGFATVDERAAFHLVTAVQGIGPKLAMSILSAMDASALGSAVRDGDHARLTKIPGIGKKTAERMVLELRDKFGAPTSSATQVSGKLGGSQAVSSALINLGYKPAEAERAAADAGKQHPGAGVAELVKAALRILAA
ncbi:MAG: Holliday junction branch migration protein RuvA [Polyangia bacterium]